MRLGSLLAVLLLLPSVLVAQTLNTQSRNALTGPRERPSVSFHRDAADARPMLMFADSVAPHRSNRALHIAIGAFAGFAVGFIAGALIGGLIGAFVPHA